MKVCIAEKPSVARDLATIVGAKNRKDGYFEGNGYQVTWTYGHFCTLKEPHDYLLRWKRWSYADLPIIPERFGIKVIEDTGIAKQLGIIQALVDKASLVINCGDAGQEGELIQRWVLQKVGCKVPVQRLWVSSLTDEAITQGFAALAPQEKYNSLYEAGLCRAIGDWLLGINATRLYTLKYGQVSQVLSVGRVQTPTLALVVGRHLEIASFIPEAFWELKTLYRGVVFSASQGKFSTQEEGRVVLDRIAEHPLCIESISKKKSDEFPPRLFDLTSLQVECNKKWAYTADDTLKTIQLLYEKKLVTYPRVDTTYLSEDLYPKVPGILSKMKSFAQLIDPLPLQKLPKSKKVFDNSKVSDHHAIIPTGNEPFSLNEQEKQVYKMIALRFIAVFYPPCKVATTTVLAEVEGIAFKATGKQILEMGWRQVYATEPPGENGGEAEPALFPAFVKGESGPHTPSLLEKYTQAPKPYTEATLLRAMETAGKLVEDEELRHMLKENGIGRPSTRAAILEMLFKRGYIVREKKNLIPTQLGIHLIESIPNGLLKSAELTGVWEKKLRQIESKHYNAQQFIAELKDMISEIVAQEKKISV